MILDIVVREVIKGGKVKEVVHEVGKEAGITAVAEYASAVVLAHSFNPTAAFVTFTFYEVTTAIHRNNLHVKAVKGIAKKVKEVVKGRKT